MNQSDCPVTDPLVHAVVDSFLVLDPHSWNFAPFNSIYTKSRKKLTAVFHVLLKLQRRRRGNWASEELVHEEPFFSIEAACGSWGSNNVHMQWGDGGEIDAQRQDRLAAATAHEGTTNARIFVRGPCPAFPYTHFPLSTLQKKKKQEKTVVHDEDDS